MMCSPLHNTAAAVRWPGWAAQRHGRCAGLELIRWACLPARLRCSSASSTHCMLAILTWGRCSRYSPSWPATRKCPG